MYYVQLDGSGHVVAVTQSAGKIEADHMIEVQKYDESLLGKHYDIGTKRFSKRVEAKDEG